MLAIHPESHEKFTLHHGDSLEVLKTLPDNSVDAIVCDPPAGIGFMGRDWDSNKGGRDAWIAWLSSIMKEGLRVLKPGGHALVWALPRTSHWTGMAVEDAGFELRDRISHLFGSGFPKSMCVSKAIDKAAGAEREVVGVKTNYHSEGKRAGSGANMHGVVDGSFSSPEAAAQITAPATEAARQWQGWGTALKPAMEDWWLARKPLSEKTVAANVLQHGTGALNIDGCRVGGEPVAVMKSTGGRKFEQTHTQPDRRNKQVGWNNAGRWPANLITDGSEEVLAGFPDGAKTKPARSGHRGGSNAMHMSRDSGDNGFQTTDGYWPADPGGSSARFFKQVSHDDEDLATMQRFMYCAKASKRDRDDGLEGFELRKAETMNSYTAPSEGRTADKNGGPKANIHPTVKPTDLMTYLCRLVTPPGGVVLDPFMGSGSTGKAAMLEGFRFIGIEREAEYIAIARARIEAAHRHACEGAARAQEPIHQPELFGKLA